VVNLNLPGQFAPGCLVSLLRILQLSAILDILTHLIRKDTRERRKCGREDQKGQGGIICYLSKSDKYFIRKRNPFLAQWRPELIHNQHKLIFNFIALSVAVNLP
jgi:hypothetical protein